MAFFHAGGRIPMYTLEVSHLRRSAMLGKKSSFSLGGVPDQVDHSNSQESLVFLEIRPVTKTYISSTIPGAFFFYKMIRLDFQGPVGGWNQERPKMGSSTSSRSRWFTWSFFASMFCCFDVVDRGTCCVFFVWGGCLNMNSWNIHEIHRLITAYQKYPGDQARGLLLDPLWFV